MLEHFDWSEKYRPRKVSDTILPKDLKDRFQGYVDQKNIPNMTLAGPPGSGKTTVARAMLEELGCNYIVINASLEGNIDTLRNKIMQFASSVSLTGGRKYVILDEADYLTNATQPALRGFIQDFSANCGFILTCNLPNKIIEPLHSRCPVIDFKITKSLLPSLASQFMKRVCWILEQESVKYNREVVAELIKKFLPDWRRIINELQQYSPSGEIDTGILANLRETSIKELMGFLKERNFTEMRKWVGENVDNDAATLYRQIYDCANQYIEHKSVPPVVLIIGKYQYQHSICVDQEINLVCCLTEIMVEAIFK